MKQFLLVFISGFFSIILSGHVCAAQYFVDFAEGNDANSGQTRTTPWKHSPGDSQALLNPKNAILKAGDVVNFKGGVSYFGRIDVLFDGDAGREITYIGEGWGEGKAVIDGGGDEQIEVNRCVSKVECYGHENWKSLMWGTVHSDVYPFATLKFNSTNYRVAQSPDLKDPFWYDDTSQYFVVPKADASSRYTEGGLVLVPKDSRNGANWRNAFVAVWGFPNVVRILPVKKYDENRNLVSFGQDIKPYFDRDSYFSIFNRPEDISEMGEVFLDSEARKILIFPYDNLKNGKVDLNFSYEPYGININGKSNINISGFIFRNQLGKMEEWYAGAGVINRTNGAKEVLVENNSFEDIFSYEGVGAIELNFIENVVVRSNILRNNKRSSGIRIYKSSSIAVEENKIERIGKTGIRLIGSNDVTIAYNEIKDILGVHGNAISVYLKNNNVVVFKNVVENSRRALTYHGNGNKCEAIGLWVIDNQFWGSVHSWGKQMCEVYFFNNLIVGEYSKGKSLSIPEDDQNVYVMNNIIDGWVVGKLPKTWRAFSNMYVGLSWKQTPKYRWRLDFNGQVKRHYLGRLIKQKNAQSLVFDQLGTSFKRLLPNSKYLLPEFREWSENPSIGPRF